MVVTLPLPPQITQYFPQQLVSFLSWFAFYTFSALLTIPWLCCIFVLITHSVGRETRAKFLLQESSTPKVAVVMPCYNEEPEVLLTAIKSVVDCDYPPSCIHIFLSFDGDQVNNLYLQTLENLGVPLPLEKYPNSLDLSYHAARITVSRFPHGGKRKCQKSTYKLIDRIYAAYLKRNDDMFVLFIDSDCILDKLCIQNFMYEMQLKPGSKRNMLAMTGVITSTTKHNSLITILQDMEYIHGQLFERSVESGCGAVTCLPGALTMLRFSAFRKMAKYYFADKAEQCQDFFDYGKCHLGEDRWLTHLFMVGAKKRYQIQMCTSAFCKTEAVQTYKSLLKQRRRWFLGYITNEASMLTDLRLWKKYPLLCLVRFMQNTIRTTALLFFIMILSLLTTEQSISNLPVGFIAVSLGLNWLLMLYFGAKLRRYKIWLYPLMFVINPFFNWCYMIYGIFTAGQRTWGGPRADAATADEQTSPEEAIEAAKAAGDDLNIVPESFKPAVEARHPYRYVSEAPLHPSDRIDGRFAAAEELPGGWYYQPNDSGLTLPNTMPRTIRMPLLGGGAESRASLRSDATRDSLAYSQYMPQPLASIMSDEDQRKWHFAQRASRGSSGVFEQDRVSGAGAGDGEEHGYANGYGRAYEIMGDESLPGRSSSRPDEAMQRMITQGDRGQDGEEEERGEEGEGDIADEHNPFQHQDLQHSSASSPSSSIIHHMSTAASGPNRGSIAAPPLDRDPGPALRRQWSFDPSNSDDDDNEDDEGNRRSPRLVRQWSWEAADDDRVEYRAGLYRASAATAAAGGTSDEQQRVELGYEAGDEHEEAGLEMELYAQTRSTTPGSMVPLMAERGR
ncbi:MAG: hypothetical protein LQ340_006781, partial [Diploschistes diacapsis]